MGAKTAKMVPEGNEFWAKKFSKTRFIIFQCFCLPTSNFFSFIFLGNTFIQIALSLGHIDVVKLLYHQGIDINITNNSSKLRNNILFFWTNYIAFFFLEKDLLYWKNCLICLNPGSHFTLIKKHVVFVCA